MILNDDKLMCAIIKVEINEKLFQNFMYCARTYAIPYNCNIEEVINYIRESGKKYDIPISRVYLSGYQLLSKNYLWDKAKLNSLFQKVKKEKQIVLKKVNY